MLWCCLSVCLLLLKQNLLYRKILLIVKVLASKRKMSKFIWLIYQKSVRAVKFSWFMYFLSPQKKSSLTQIVCIITKKKCLEVQIYLLLAWEKQQGKSIRSAMLWWTQNSLFVSITFLPSHKERFYVCF